MFELQIKNINKLQPKDCEDTTFSEAIESIYGWDDQVIILWHQFEIPISIKWDISDSWFDIIKMVKDLESNKTEFGMQWPSQSFFAFWRFKETDPLTWEISADWGFETIKIINVPKISFLEQWKKLVSKVESDLISQGYDLSTISFHGEQIRSE